MSAAELFDLTGRVALVTGASSGLGLRFAQVLAGAGAAVVLVGRRAERLAAVQAGIEAAGGRALAVGADVLDRRAMTRAFEQAQAAFGCVTANATTPASMIAATPSTTYVFRMNLSRYRLGTPREPSREC
jgi:NADP-dependent 3-hydroxy acid dehydrogenase YdfG